MARLRDAQFAQVEDLEMQKKLLRMGNNDLRAGGGRQLRSCYAFQNGKKEILKKSIFYEDETNARI